MENTPTVIDTTDNGGRRRLRDRRYLVSVPVDRERRVNWDRRSGVDRRMRRILGASVDHVSVRKSSTVNPSPRRQG